MLVQVGLKRCTLLCNTLLSLCLGGHGADCRLGLHQSISLESSFQPPTCIICIHLDRSLANGILSEKSFRSNTTR